MMIICVAGGTGIGMDTGLVILRVLHRQHNIEKHAYQQPLYILTEMSLYLNKSVSINHQMKAIISSIEKITIMTHANTLSISPIIVKSNKPTVKNVTEVQPVACSITALIPLCLTNGPSSQSHLHMKFSGHFSFFPTEKNDEHKEFLWITISFSRTIQFQWLVNNVDG